MPHFVTLMNWTEQGAKTFRDTVDRAEGARATLQSQGVTLKDIYWTIGIYDLVCTIEAADDATASAALLALGAQGNLRTIAMRAFTVDEFSDIVERAG
jgi:uncharacterized protein with GYD domain